jgi:hypothetical protein
MPSLKKTFLVINGMVEDGVLRKYAVAGAVAALNYIETSTTYDLDLLVSVEDFQTGGQSGLVTLGPVVSYLRERGYTEFRNEGIVIEGWPVQFLPVASDLDAEGLAEAVQVELEPGGGLAPIKVATLTAEHIVATALKVGRPKDHERILRFIDEKAVNLEVLRDVLDRHNLRKAWSKFCYRMELPDFK